MRFIRLLLLLLLVFLTSKTFAQDVDLYLTDHYLAGKSIIKVNRDFEDAYMWILAQNNEVYRINTVTKQLDNYTPQFQTLSAYQIFDIVGFGPDWVILALKNTSGTLLVSYHNGVIGHPIQDGLYNVNGNIRSIGASSGYTELAYGVYDHPVLLIATDQAFYRLSFDTEKTLSFNSAQGSHVYSATYRNQLFRNDGEIDTTAGVNYVPLLGTTAGFSHYTGLMRKHGIYGDTINTAYFTINEIFDTKALFTPDVFWGNAQGLHQVKLRGTTPFLSSYRHYLDNIQINKITDIFGLTTFGNSGAKENLLVGTDNGLYYSNSLIHVGMDTIPDNITLYHYDKLGNIPINFVEVNFKSNQPPFCEDGIWLATNDGLYLLKPDYAAHVNPGQLVNSVHFNNQDVAITATQICQGGNTVAELNDDVSANSIQWFKNEQELINESNTSLTITTAGEYYAVLYDPCAGVHVESNHLTVTVISAPVFSFNYPDKIQQCDNTPVVLTTDNNPAYTYRWYTNGVLNGATTSSFTVTQTGKYKVEVSSCTNTWVPSKEVEVDMVTLPIPLITADKTIYCADDQATLTVNTPTDASYTINWYRDGNLLAADQNLTAIHSTTAGNYTVIVSSNIASCTQSSNSQQLSFTPAPVFTFNYPDELRYCSGTPTILKAEGSAAYQYRWYKDGTLTGDVTAALTITQAGKYKVEVSSCAGSWVPSKEVQVDFVQLPLPVITANKQNYCIGDIATLTITVPTSPFYSINWYKDNVPLPGDKDQTSINTAIAGNYTVSVLNNEANTDGSTCSQVSAAQPLIINPLPTVNIQKIIKTTLCDGQTVDLKVQYAGGTVQWSTGETSDEISVSQAGNYKVTVSSPAGCQASANVDVTFLPEPILNVADASLCTYTHQTITLTAPPGFAQYAWNGAPGEQTYQVSIPQTIELTVADANGCQATQQIHVTDQCAEVHIPNTFTPNGDGINDTWNIAGLEYDQTATVKIYSRYGQQVYESKGYGTPWNGESQGKKLPTGVYYYIITSKSGKEKFSGSVTIIY